MVEESSVFTKSNSSIGFVDEKYNLSITTNTVSIPFQINRINNHEEYRLNEMVSFNEFDNNSTGNTFRVNFENNSVKIITQYNTFGSESIENTISFKNTGGIVIDNLQNSDGVKYALKSEIEELKTTIQTLTERLASLESK